MSHAYGPKSTLAVTLRSSGAAVTAVAAAVTAAAAVVAGGDGGGAVRGGGVEEAREYPDTQKLKRKAKNLARGRWHISSVKRKL
ncbi:hypothetical protein QBC39DRAFT_376176 [Podospora conica]|nr:hypothetical protein QBC39DRAFT_376176 [Schizothecium conicum]